MSFKENLDKIRAKKIVAIIRGADPADIISIATALRNGGIQLLEVTLNSPNALQAIGELSKKMSNDMLIGAGTVLDETQAKQAVDAGACFIISPSFEPAVITTAKKSGIISIPGAFTATEILAAYRQGGDIIKLFPASVGPHYIKDIRGPLPHIPLMPTGGIDTSNINAYFNAGAVAVGIGSALVDTKEKVTDKYLTDLELKAGKFVTAIQSIT